MKHTSIWRIFLSAIHINCVLCIFPMISVETVAAEGMPVTVYVVNYPLKYFAERIGADHARVTLPVPSNIDPAFWTPNAEAIARYQQADLILVNGAGYARWRGYASLPLRKVVDTSASFAADYIAIQTGSTHSHGREGDHARRGTAATTWLDFDQAVAQAEAIAEALSKLAPQNAPVFSENLQVLISQLEVLDQRMERAGQSLAARPVIFSHPVYQYLQRAYRLNGRTVHWEPNQMPDQEAWMEIERLLGEHDAQIMIWEAAPTPEIHDRLGHLGVEVAVFELANVTPAQGDFVSVMAANIERLEQAIAETRPDRM